MKILALLTTVLLTAAASPLRADVILSADFTGRSVSGSTASNILWTANGATTPGGVAGDPITLNEAVDRLGRLEDAIPAPKPGRMVTLPHHASIATMSLAGSDLRKAARAVSTVSYIGCSPSTFILRPPAAQNCHFPRDTCSDTFFLRPGTCDTKLAVAASLSAFHPAQGARPTSFLPLSEPLFSPTCAPIVKNNFLALIQLQLPKQ